PTAAPGSAPAGGTGGIASPIAGTVLEVRCKPGQSVVAGQDLVVIEAMKMETVIAAPGAGTVKSVLVAAGDSVRENQTLVEFA
ncbi:MAG: acetyl-CoA carboxylase biotin carboxyl carrier protein subunit, partial [Krumholzibacteria bacterium]|nr:acetyl-CoA carboxylase biotin carboxyl carrier protein subunit [Candidatus Krumholzibacteria bacterium]